MDESHVEDGGCGGNAAPYVLGALTDTEHAEFVRHMESCAVCREEVAALQMVAANLPAAAPQVSAPPEIKRRVMAIVHQEAPTRRSSEAAQAQPAPERRLTWRPAVALVSLAVVAVAIALAVVAIAPGGGGGSTRVISAEVTPPRANASLRLSGKHAELDIAGMPQLPANRVYEVWIERSGAAEPTDALFSVTGGGDASVNVPGDLHGAQAVMVTAEPLGGSRMPTSMPVIRANLT
jgi:anti-sigma-K factor RskA